MKSIAFAFLALFAAANAPAQVSIPLKGTTYQFTGQPRWLLDGPSGPITARSKDPDGAGPAVAPKAVLSNLAWKSLLDAANTTLASGYDKIGYGYSGDTAQLFATVCFADNSQTGSCNAARDMLNHVELYVPFGYCLESQPKCSSGNGDYGITSYGNYWISGWTGAFTMMHDLLTATERHTFVAKLLNDISYYGGTNSSATTSCTNTTFSAGATLTAVGPNVTASSAIFGTRVHVGDWIGLADGGNPVKVASITDGTHAAVNVDINGAAGPVYVWPASSYNPATDCGWLWASKHDVSYPYTLTLGTAEPGSPTLYPTTGGTQSGHPNDYGSSNLQYTDLWGTIQMLNVSFEDDPNFAVRSGREMTLAYNFWHDSIYYWAENTWTGFTSSGAAYGYDRAAFMVPGIAFMIQNQVSPALPLMNGVWAKNLLTATFMNTYPGEPASLVQWGQLYAADGVLGINVLNWLPMLIRAFNGTNEAGWANYWMRNTLRTADFHFGVVPGVENQLWTEAAINTRVGGNAPSVTALLTQSWFYLFSDPDDPALNLSSAPLQKAFNVTDASQYPLAHFISRTSLTDYNASMVEVYSDYMVNWENGDHVWNGGNAGSYKVIKNNLLLNEDDAGGVNPGGLFSGGYSAQNSGAGDMSNYIQLGSDATIAWSAAGHRVLMPRAYDGNNDAAYVMVDAAKAYNNNPTRVYRHVMHLKKSGTQDFVIVYDDVATATGVKKTTFLHYANNGTAPRGATAYSSGAIVSSYPGTGHGDATQLLTETFSPAGPGKTILRDDGVTFAGSGQNAYRYSLCASTDGATCDTANLNAEFLVVHMPVAGTNNSFPTATNITGANFAGLQVAGLSPKIAMFPRKGQWYTTIDFVSDYQGVGQIGIAGLRKGTYQVTRNGVVQPPVTVGADGFFYCTGESGSYSIGLQGGSGTQTVGASVKGAQIH